MINKVKDILAKDFVQRTLYGVGLILWTILAWDNISRYPYSESSIGVNYLTLYTVPTIMLVLQIIRNNKLLWGLVFGLVTAFIIISFYLALSDSIERSGNHVKAIEWDIRGILFLIAYFVILLIADWTVYNMRPKRLI